MKSIVPAKLQRGNIVRVIAPSRSMAILSDELKQFAATHFETLGLKLEFGAHVDEDNYARSSSVQSRVEDIHSAFRDSNVKAIFTVIGGFNSNQLLNHLDWKLIQNNPKILCGYSDITVLQNALYAKTGIISYYGPHYSTLGQKQLSEYTIEHLKKTLFQDEAFLVEPSKDWSDDQWYKNQNNRNLIQNEGYWAIHPGSAKGVIIGGNLCTFNLLQGTEYMPNVEEDIVAFFEDDSSVDLATFDRDLESFLQTDIARRLEGLVIGRFQQESEITRADLLKLISNKPQLADIPVVANVDFGHTDPMITIPIGGTVKLEVRDRSTQIEIGTH